MKSCNLSGKSLDNQLKYLGLIFWCLSHFRFAVGAVTILYNVTVRQSPSAIHRVCVCVCVCVRVCVRVCMLTCIRHMV